MNCKDTNDSILNALDNITKRLDHIEEMLWGKEAPSHPEIQIEWDHEAQDIKIPSILG